MSEKTDEQIVSEIETHTANALKLLKRAREIQKSALQLDDVDACIAAMKRAVALHEFSAREMQKAAGLQKIYSERLNSLEHMRKSFGLF